MSGQKGARSKRQNTSHGRNPGCPTPAKHGYLDRTQARRVLRLLKAERESLHVYKCACGLFHLGNMEAGLHRDRSPIAPPLELAGPVCGKRFKASGHVCAFVPTLRAIGAGTAWLCDLHWLELQAAAERIRARRAA